MSSRKGTKRNIIEIEHPGQEQHLGQRESSRARRADTTSPVLTRQDRPSSTGLRSATVMRNGTGAIAQSATDRTSTSSSAGGAALARADTEPMSSTGAGSSDNDQAGTPSEDNVSESRTQDGAHQATTMISRSSVHAEEHLPAEPITDFEVNEPHWDSHVVPTVPEADAAIIRRQRVLYQGGRRVSRGRSAEDQTLILAGYSSHKSC